MFLVWDHRHGARFQRHMICGRNGIERQRWGGRGTSKGSERIMPRKETQRGTRIPSWRGRERGGERGRERERKGERERDRNRERDKAFAKLGKKQQQEERRAAQTALTELWHGSFEPPPCVSDAPQSISCISPLQLRLNPDSSHAENLRWWRIEGGSPSPGLYPRPTVSGMHATQRGMYARELGRGRSRSQSKRMSLTSRNM